MSAIGPYLVESELGRGGMGVVLKARSAEGRIVAVKVIHRRGSPDALARFDRERRLLASLGTKSGFVPLLDQGESPAGPWFAMPLVEGGDLRKRLAGGALSIGESVAIVVQLARIMGLAHERGIVHRDLKPENVLFTKQGRPLVSDLGLGKHFRDDVSGASQSVCLSVAGEMKGTVGYMAPEQLSDASSAGPPADVFALGAILYECLAGKPAFEGGSVFELVARMEKGEHVPLREARPDVPSWLAVVVERTLAVDPAMRPKDGLALERALGGGPKPWRFPRRLAIAVLAALLLVAGSREFFRPPELVAEDVKVPGDTAEIGGRARHTLEVTLDGATVPHERDGSFSTTVKLARRTTTFELAARGRGGTVSKRITVTSAWPDWFMALAPERRPRRPKWLAPGENPGEYVWPHDGSVLVHVPGAVFVRDVRDASMRPRSPTYEVSVSDFFVGKYEVTNDQFRRFVAARLYATTAEREDRGTLVGDGIKPERGVSWRNPHGVGAGAGDHPVVQVNWDDATAYCEWARVRLPTEAEWELAALKEPGSTALRENAWGDATPGPGTPIWANLGDVALGRVFPGRRAEGRSFAGYDDGFARTAPVGRFPLGASPCGALDMSGNVAEWCADVFDDAFYARAPREDPVCTSVPELDGRGGERVKRGPSWYDSPAYTRSRLRLHHPRTWRADCVGFRVALSAPRPGE